MRHPGILVTCAALTRGRPRSRNEMMRTWEEKVKFRFGNSSGTYEVSVPGVPNNEETAVEDGFHTMEEEDVRKIFDPVVDRIERLVKQQVQGVRGKGESVAVNHTPKTLALSLLMEFCRQSFSSVASDPQNTF